MNIKNRLFWTGVYLIRVLVSSGLINYFCYAISFLSCSHQENANFLQKIKGSSGICNLFSYYCVFFLCNSGCSKFKVPAQQKQDMHKRKVPKSNRSKISERFWHHLSQKFPDICCWCPAKPSNRHANNKRAITYCKKTKRIFYDRSGSNLTLWLTKIMSLLDYSTTKGKQTRFKMFLVILVKPLVFKLQLDKKRFRSKALNKKGTNLNCLRTKDDDLSSFLGRSEGEEDVLSFRGSLVEFGRVYKLAEEVLEACPPLLEVFSRTGKEKKMKLRSVMSVGMEYIWFVTGLHKTGVG